MHSDDDDPPSNPPRNDVASEDSASVASSVDDAARGDEHDAERDASEHDASRTNATALKPPRLSKNVKRGLIGAAIGGTVIVGGALAYYELEGKTNSAS